MVVALESEDLALMFATLALIRAALSLTRRAIALISAALVLMSAVLVLISAALVLISGALVLISAALVLISAVLPPFGRKLWPTWPQLGSQDGAKMKKKSMPKSIKKLMHLGIDFLKGFGRFLGAKMVPCWHQNGIKNRC